MTRYDTGGATGADSDDAAVIEAEIAQTRVQMGGTLDAIQERLAPETLKEQATDVVHEAAEQAKEVIQTAVREAGEQAREVVREATAHAKEAVHDATIGKAEHAVSGATQSVKGIGTGMFDSIKQNPVPAALVGIGLGWLFMKSRGGSSATRQPSDSRAVHAAYAYGAYGAEPYVGDDPGFGEYGSSGYQPAGYPNAERYEASRHASSENGGGVGDTAGRIAGQAKDTVSDVAGSAKDAVGQATEAAGEVASQVQDAAGRLVGGVTERTGQITSGAGDRFSQMSEESPLMLGGLALALGTAVGLLIPSTDQEDKLIGRTRDSMLQQAKQTAKDLQPALEHAVDSAQDAIKETVQGAKDEVTEQLSGSSGRATSPDQHGEQQSQRTESGQAASRR